jgi:hypothetical protein
VEDCGGVEGGGVRPTGSFERRRATVTIKRRRKRFTAADRPVMDTAVFIRFLTIFFADRPASMARVYVIIVVVMSREWAD